MGRTVSKNIKKGIEITRWKVGHADNFQCIEQGEDYGIELTPPERYEEDVSEQEHDIRQLPKPYKSRK